MSRVDFIDSLVADLKPTRRSRPWSHVMFVWCGLSWSVVGLAILANGPLREGFAHELIASPRYMLELSFGVLAGLVSIAAGLEIGVPGSPKMSRLWSPPLLLFAGWAMTIAYGLTVPIAEFATGGMRAHCFLETILVSLPPATLAVYLLHGRIVFDAGRSGLLAGVAAAAIPALWMEFACMTEPLHALKFHLSPILLIGGFTALVTHWMLESR